MHTYRTLPALIACAALLVACGDDDPDSGSTNTATSIDMVTTSAAVEATTTSAVAPTTTEAPALAQPAIWPAAGVVFTTPEEAAADFVSAVFGVEPLLGDFQGGDSRSGEIEVFSPGESTPISRSLLYLRQLAPSDSWFVIGAFNENVTIATPETSTEVPAGALTVEGVGRGFETTVVVTAFIAGSADTMLDQVITAGGARETPEPYSVTLDLTGAAPGDFVMLLVRGDTGLDNDPGEFGAIPVVIAG